MKLRFCHRALPIALLVFAAAPAHAQEPEETASATRPPALLDSVTIGPIVVRNVPASINPGLRDMDILLGMSVLKRIEFTQRGDTLILRPYE